MVTTEEKKYRSISEWTNEFAALYKKHDKHRSPEDIWISTMAYGSVIGEAIRRYDFNSLIRSASHAFCWMCTFITKCNKTDDLLFKLDHSFVDLVALKFPNACGHCTHDHCICDSAAQDSKPDKSAKYHKLLEKWRRIDREKYSIDEWLHVFSDIYLSRIHLQTLETIGFHFLEEAGEMAQAIRELRQMQGILSIEIQGVDTVFLEKLIHIEGLVEEYTNCMSKIDNDKSNIDIKSNDPIHIKARIVKSKMDQVIEFADTFSWFCAILIKLKLLGESLDIPNDKINLEIYLEHEYGEKSETIKCPSCNSSDCKCLFFPK